MAAIIDKKKPLRLIGVQIFEGTSIEVRKTLNPGWFPFIKCSNSKEMGTSKDKYPVVDSDVCPHDYYSINDDLPRISISAIVGKNGTGKSSLMEIIYLILNNFAECIVHNSDENKDIEIIQCKGIEARLFFELDGVQKYIECSDKGTKYFKSPDNEVINIQNLTVNQRYDVLSGFFYTIVMDYSLYGLNPLDYKFKNTGLSLNRLFNKTDDYYIPLILTPYRKNGQINVNYENALAKKRIEILSLLFHSQNKEFLNDYVPYRYKYAFNDKYKEAKLNDLENNPIIPEMKILC
jgi:hypothetical protein